MDPLVSTLVVILLALLGARLSFSTERVPEVTRLLFRTGTHFLFIGLALGPLALDLLTPEALDRLAPLFGIGLGWVGLIFGLQLERETLSRFPLPFHGLALGQAGVTFVIFVAGGGLIAALTGSFEPVSVVLLIAAGATAAVSAPAGIAMISTNFLVRGQVRRLLFFTASVDGLVGLVVLQALYGALHGGWLSDAAGAGAATVAADASGTVGQLSVLWFLAGPALGLVCGVLVVWLMRLRPDREELILYLMGSSALCAGAALQLGVSPLFAGTVMGAIVANLVAERSRLFTALQKWEQPVYLLLLMIAGASLRVTTWWVVPLALLYTGLRIVGKLGGTALLARALPLGFALPRGAGLGLIPQGGISLAMAVSLSLVLSDRGLMLAGLDGVDVLFSTIVIGVVLSELVGPIWTAQVLRRAGEIRSEVEAAIAEGDEERARTEAIRHHAPGSNTDANTTTTPAPEAGIDPNR